jgi:hypothetical protein
MAQAFQNLSKKIEKVEYESLNGHFYDTQEEAEEASKLFLILNDITDNVPNNYSSYDPEDVVTFLLKHYNIEPKETS